MRLRNKKTGKIYTLSEDLYIEYTQGGKIEVRAIIPGGNMSYYYDSLEKLNEDWEDVKEPLIKDPKIRKAVRAWSEVNEFKPDYTVKYCLNCYSLISWQADIEFNGNIEGLEDGKEYTIAELCGSEEIEILEPTYTTIEEKEKLKEKQ